MIAAEGGYQAFHLAGADWSWLVLAGAAALVASAAGFVLVRLRARAHHERGRDQQG